MYRPKDPRQERNWMNHNLDFDAVDIVFRSEFRPNRLCGFVKSARSFHGFSPVECDPDRMRLSFNFNVLIDPIEAESRPIRRLNAWRKRRETSSFAGLKGTGR